MIIQFSVRNFRSFKDLATFSLVAEGLKPTVDTYTARGDMELLPVAGIFGANASGKSNLVKALAFLQGSIVTPPTPGMVMGVQYPLRQPFILDAENQKQPSWFEIVVWDSREKDEYRYSFEMSPKRIVSEKLELTQVASKNYSRSLVFKRSKDTYEFGARFKKQLEPLTANVLPEAHAVYVFAQFAHVESNRFIALIRQINLITGSDDMIVPELLDHMVENRSYHEAVVCILKQADIGLQDLVVERRAVTPEEQRHLRPEYQMGSLQPGSVVMNYKVRGLHKVAGGAPIEIDLNDESLGTNRLLGYASFITHVLELGRVLVIDEFMSSIHPIVSSQLLRLFQNKETNPHGAQLIFVSHDTNLLNDETGLRRDQVWFTEKNAAQESTLFSLSEYATRPDLNIQKNYLKGRFGAIPVTMFE